MVVMNAVNEPVPNRIFLGDFWMLFREEVIIVVVRYYVFSVFGIPRDALLINVTVFGTESSKNEL